jgi:hypothetical protein
MEKSTSADKESLFQSQPEPSYSSRNVMIIANEWNPSPSSSEGESPIKTSFGNSVSDLKRVRMEGQSRKGRIEWSFFHSPLSFHSYPFPMDNAKAFSLWFYYGSINTVPKWQPGTTL